jgi:hypothetical protein
MSKIRKISTGIEIKPNFVRFSQEMAGANRVPTS